jgi:hypothetical protein
MAILSVALAAAVVTAAVTGAAGLSIAEGFRAVVGDRSGCHATGDYPDWARASSSTSACPASPSPS